MAETTITFTMQLGSFKAQEGDRFGDVILHDGWYVVRKFMGITDLFGPIDDEAVAKIAEQQISWQWHASAQAARDSLKGLSTT